MTRAEKLKASGAAALLALVVAPIVALPVALFATPAGLGVIVLAVMAVLALGHSIRMLVLAVSRSGGSVSQRWSRGRKTAREDPPTSRGIVGRDATLGC
jgi:hypothetical protein